MFLRRVDLSRKRSLGGGKILQSVPVFLGRAKVVGQARLGLVGLDVFFEVEVGGDPLEKNHVS